MGFARARGRARAKGEGSGSEGQSSRVRRRDGLGTNRVEGSERRPGGISEWDQRRARGEAARVTRKGAFPSRKMYLFNTEDFDIPRKRLASFSNDNRIFTLALTKFLPGKTVPSHGRTIRL